METTKKLIASVEKFNTDLRAFAEETGEDIVTLYEDAFTTREVKADFHLCKNGVLTWTERENGTTHKERYEHFDDDDVRDTLRFWRAALRRAKRYWATDADTLDKIQDGEIEDKDED